MYLFHCHRKERRTALNGANKIRTRLSSNDPMFTLLMSGSSILHLILNLSTDAAIQEREIILGIL